VGSKKISKRGQCNYSALKYFHPIAQPQVITRLLRVQFSSFLFLTSFSVRKFSHLKRINNSVLDFALCEKSKTFKALTTSERLKVQGNQFYLSW